MLPNRREFFGSTAAIGASLALNVPYAAQAEEPPVAKAPRPLRILILGGTGFIGPHQVRYALARGHHVTLFNRGRTNPGLFPNVEQLEGDRNGKLDALKGRDWDVVIDNPATLPRWVRDAAQLLKDHARQYIFISTVSVYADNDKPDSDESAGVATTDAPEAEKVTGLNYGALKALAEKEAEKAFPGHTTIIRPGLIVGPGDTSDRFTYWPVRIDRGGNVLAPGEPGDPVQFIDARDLGEWCIRMAEQGEAGVYNALGPKAPLSIAEMLYGIRAITSADVRFTWVPASFLDMQKVSPWADMPVWVPGQGETAGFSRRSNKRAVEKGLTFRPSRGYGKSRPQRLSSTAGCKIWTEASGRARLTAGNRSTRGLERTQETGLMLRLGKRSKLKFHARREYNASGEDFWRYRLLPGTRWQSTGMHASQQVEPAAQSCASVKRPQNELFSVVFCFFALLRIFFDRGEETYAPGYRTTSTETRRSGYKPRGTKSSRRLSAEPGTDRLY